MQTDLEVLKQKNTKRLKVKEGGTDGGGGREGGMDGEREGGGGRRDRPPETVGKNKGKQWEKEWFNEQKHLRSESWIIIS